MSVIVNAFHLRNARADEHAKLLKVAKTSWYTSDYGNRIMFTSDAAYGKGWIRAIYANKGAKAEPIGVYCIRNKVRGDKATKLYFITVLPEWRSKGVGMILMEDLKRTAVRHNGIIELDVAKDNDQAKKFYERHGFKVEHGDALDGGAWRMKWKHLPE